jgi:hypothetical protein
MVYSFNLVFSRLRANALVAPPGNYFFSGFDASIRIALNTSALFCGIVVRILSNKWPTVKPSQLDKNRRRRAPGQR